MNDLTLAEAQQCAREAFGDQVELSTNEKGVHTVKTPNGETFKALNWRGALRAAISPLLEKQAREQRQQTVAMQAEAVAFMVFLKEKYLKEFNEWKAKQEQPSRIVQP